MKKKNYHKLNLNLSLKDFNSLIKYIARYVCLNYIIIYAVGLLKQLLILQCFE